MNLLSATIRLIVDDGELLYEGHVSETSENRTYGNAFMITSRYRKDVVKKVAEYLARRVDFLEFGGKIND